MHYFQSSSPTYVRNIQFHPEPAIQRRKLEKTTTDGRSRFFLAPAAFSSPACHPSAPFPVGNATVPANEKACETLPCLKGHIRRRHLSVESHLREATRVREQNPTQLGDGLTGTTWQNDPGGRESLKRPNPARAGVPACLPFNGGKDNYNVVVYMKRSA